MQPQPLYRPTVENAAYQLRYSWTGWPSTGSFASQPIELIEATKPQWETDHLRVLEYRWTPDLVQILFSVTPDVSPEFVARRAKGRLDHALRAANIDSPFSRKVAIRAVGENTERDVEAYIARQVSKEHFVDPRFADRMRELIFIDSQLDLAQPTETTRGRYWCNLHLVLVVERHTRIEEIKILHEVRDIFLRIAAKKQHAVSHLAVMQDHLHASIRTGAAESPLDVVYAYQNNLAYLLNHGRIWSSGFYVGTFGSYSMQAIRNRIENA